MSEAGRDLGNLAMRAATTLVFACALAALHAGGGADDKSPDGASQDRVGALFFMVRFLALFFFLFRVGCLDAAGPARGARRPRPRRGIGAVHSARPFYRTHLTRTPRSGF